MATTPPRFARSSVPWRRVRGGGAARPGRGALPRGRRRAPARRGSAGRVGCTTRAGRALQAALSGDPSAPRGGAPPRRRRERHGPRIHRGPAAGPGRPAGRVCPTGTQRKERPMTRWISGATGLALAVALVAVIPRFGFTKPEAPLWIDRPVTSGTSAPAASPWVELARALKPAVTNISTKRVDAGNQFFDQFFGGRPRRMVRSLGSGFLTNPAGFIVTNNHVVDGATEIKVTLADGRQLPGRLLGRDPKTDIALLKVEATGLPVIPLGDSVRPQVVH